MFITHKSNYPRWVFWKYFKYGKHLSETVFTVGMVAKPDFKTGFETDSNPDLTKN